MKFSKFRFDKKKLSTKNKINNRRTSRWSNPFKKNAKLVVQCNTCLQGQTNIKLGEKKKLNRYRYHPTKTYN